MGIFKGAIRSALLGTMGIALVSGCGLNLGTSKITTKMKKSFGQNLDGVVFAANVEPGEEKALVKWDAVSGVDQYTVQTCAAVDAEDEMVSCSAETFPASPAEIALDPEKEYSVVVSYESGKRKGHSPVPLAVEAFAKNTVVVEPKAGGLSVSWASDRVVASYVVSYSTDSAMKGAKTVTSATNSASIVPADLTKAYYVSVLVKKKTGSKTIKSTGAFTPLSGTMAIPDAPASATATLVSGSIEVKWTAAKDSKGVAIDTYQINRWVDGKDNGSWKTVSSPNPVTDANVPTNHKYSYVVYTSLGGTLSKTGATTSEITVGAVVPDPPVPSGPIGSFNIDASPHATNKKVVVVRLTSKPANEGTLRYKALRAPKSNPDAWVDGGNAAIDSAGMPSFEVDPGNDDEFHYLVQAVRPGTSNPFSNSSPSGYLRTSGRATNPDPMKPGAPQITKAEGVSPNAIRVEWNRDTSLRYTLQRADACNGTFVNVEGVDNVDGAAAEAKGLAASKTYCFRLYARNSSGTTSDASATKEGRTKDNDPMAPKMPGKPNFSDPVEGNDSITISWSEVKVDGLAMKYNVYRLRNNAFNANTANVSPNGPIGPNEIVLERYLDVTETSKKFNFPLNSVRQQYGYLVEATNQGVRGEWNGGWNIPKNVETMNKCPDKASLPLHVDVVPNASKLSVGWAGITTTSYEGLEFQVSRSCSDASMNKEFPVGPGSGLMDEGLNPSNTYTYTLRCRRANLGLSTWDVEKVSDAKRPEKEPTAGICAGGDANSVDCRTRIALQRACKIAGEKKDGTCTFDNNGNPQTIMLPEEQCRERKGAFTPPAGGYPGANICGNQPWTAEPYTKLGTLGDRLEQSALMSFMSAIDPGGDANTVLEYLRTFHGQNGGFLPISVGTNDGAMALFLKGYVCDSSMYGTDDPNSKESCKDGSDKDKLKWNADEAKRLKLTIETAIARARGKFGGRPANLTAIESTKTDALKFVQNHITVLQCDSPKLLVTPTRCECMGGKSEPETITIVGGGTRLLCIEDESKAYDGDVLRYVKDAQDRWALYKGEQK